MITLTKTALSEITYKQQHAWSFSVNAVSDPADLGNEIFVMHEGAGVDGGDVFSCIASLPQMDELPVDAPVAVDGETIPFYRVGDITFTAFNADELEELWQKILLDVQLLVDNYKAQQNLTESTTTVIS
jgi:hypothetical protein